MEHIIINIRERLLERKKKQLVKIRNLDATSNRDSILIKTGQIIEIDFILSIIDKSVVFKKT